MMPNIRVSPAANRKRSIPKTIPLIVWVIKKAIVHSSRFPCPLYEEGTGELDFHGSSSRPKKENKKNQKVMKT
jgi:hypothetical protein